MNELYQYDPFMGGPVRPSFGVTPTDNVLDALFKDLTRRQILNAFGGQAPAGFLDMLMNPQVAQVTASASQSAPAGSPTGQSQGTMMALPDGRNDGYDSGSLHGGDGYGLYGDHSAAKQGVNMADAYAQYAQSLESVGQGNLSGAPMAELQEASSTHGGGPSGPGGKGG